MGVSLQLLAEEHPEIKVVGCDIRDAGIVSLRERWLWPRGASFSVSLIPTTILFVNGQPELTIYGPKPKALLEEILRPWLKGTAPGPPPLAEGLPLTQQEQEALDRYWRPVVERKVSGRGPAGHDAVV